MTVLRIEGFVIVSADGMLADATHEMPATLKFAGDQHFFNAALDRVDLVVHGRRSFEDQPNSPRRTRLILTRDTSSLAPDPVNPKATLWNPAGASFEAACDAAGVRAGTAAIIGGPAVFAMFFGRYDTFWLSEAPQVHIPGGLGVFPGVPERTPHDILRASGLRPTERRILEAEGPVTVTAWRRPD
ncbi:MAG: dihydrofolate reductase [Pseudomonadota bacterium]